MTRRLFYIAPARMPTDKAHGYQIAKMCEAWSACGIEVHLVVPRRNNLIDRDLFEYYGIPRTFTVHYVHVTDAFQNSIVRRFHLSLLAYAILMQGFLSALRKFVTVHMHEGDILYTRAWEVAWLFRARRNLIWEVHEITRLQRLTPRLYARVAGIVVLTSSLRDIVLAYGVPPGRILVAPDAVDMRLFLDPSSVSEARRRLGIFSDHIAIGYVGRLSLHGKKEKGVSDLLAAFALLRSWRRDIVLVIVGGPPSALARYQALARALGVFDSVVFAGHVPRADVPLWIMACDILAIPLPKTPFSSWYTSPLKLFEYMASGRPIIASDLPSLRDILDERTAIFAPASDPSGLAHVSMRLILDPLLRERLGRAARNAVLRHTWDARAIAISHFMARMMIPNSSI